MSTLCKIESGSVVRRLHPFDGTLQAGKAIGKFLHVLKVEDVTDGPNTETMITLDDGKTEFWWNLVEVDVDV